MTCMTDGPSVLCVGHINVDRVVHTNEIPDPERSSETNSSETIGGGATNTALILANRPDVEEVYLAGSIGQDDRADYVESVLRENGITPCFHRKSETTLIRAVITEETDPRYFHESAHIPEFSSNIVDANVWDELDHMHITSFHNEVVPEFVTEANNYDISMSFNPTQGFAESDFSDVIPDVDLIQVNQDEFEVLTRRNGPVGGIVDDMRTDVVVTHSGAGCTLYSRDGLAHHQGFRVDSVVDTVGAGDSFMAGLISGWLNEDEFSGAIELANAFGANSVEHMGAPNSISQERVNELINQQ